MSRVQSIKCTNCAAPLKLLGGGRVESITCSYCTSVLDLTDNYKVLSNFKNVKESYTLPFEVGMKGKLKEVEYTIIGRISYMETIHVEHTWSDFLLFSPLYGYAWLTYEQGHLLYSKRNRTFPNLTWEEIEHQSLVMVDAKDYKPYDAYTAKVTYVEGELTWIAKYGDKINYIDLVSAPFGITVENNGNEIEFYNDEYMDAEEVYEAFSVPKENRDSDKNFHPLKPFSQPFLKELSKISLWFIVIVALLMALFVFDGSGKTIASFKTANLNSVTEPFTLSSTSYLTTIGIKANSAEALNNFNIKLFKDEKLIFSMTPNNAYIFDEATGKVSKRLDSWERRAKEIVVYLDLEKLGVYQLSVIPIDSAVASVLDIKVQENYSRLNYLIMFGVALLLSFLLYYFFVWRYKSKQYSENEIEDKESIFDSIDDWGQVIIWIVVVLAIIFFGED
jgi:nitrogen fixation-related uncharacterized protein